jgi:mannose-6-phosphate isomerase-like protein (cupin superfamily)
LAYSEPLPPPRHAESEVAKRVVRFRGSSPSAPGIGALPVLGGAVPLPALDHVEPDGLTITLHRFPPRSDGELSKSDRGCELLLGLSGRVTVFAEGRGMPLYKLDAALIPRATERRVRNDGNEDARVLSVVIGPVRGAGPSGPYVPRLVRFADLRTVRSRPLMRLVPGGFNEVLSPRDLYLLVGPEEGTRRGVRYALTGPAKVQVALVGTPPGNGPALHVHRTTDEIFVVLEGRYRITWGDTGEHQVDLGPLDSIAVPAGVNRRFENIGKEPGFLLPIVLGVDDELEDLAWLPAIEAELRRRVPGVFVDVAKRIGLAFRPRLLAGR